jgi:excisionase family DNA binding protein
MGHKTNVLPFRPTHVLIAPIDPIQILTLAEVAERLKVSERWVYEKTRGRCHNPLPVIRIGRYLRFDWTDVSSWLTEQKKAAA